MIRQWLACIPRFQIRQKKKLPYIPDDIMLEILSRLPAKSVMKFRRVCKKWLHLTSSAYFTEIHCKRAAPLLLAQYNIGTDIPMDLEWVRLDLCVVDPDAKDKKRMFKRVVNGPVAMRIDCGDVRTIVASGDGLVVLALVNIENYLVCNVLTGEQVIVKEPPKQDPPSPKSSIHCIFFHPPTGEYRMLFWRKIRPHVEMFQFWIYSFKDDAWRDISTFEHLPSTLVNPVVLNNTLHWMASCTYDYEWHYYYDHAHPPPCKTPIITFDMVSEKFSLMHYPPEVDDCCPGKKLHETIFLLDMNGQLTLCSISVGFIELWVLVDYDKQSWVRKHRMEFHFNVDKYPFRFRNFDPTYFSSTIKRPAIGDGELLAKWLLKGLTQYQLDDEIVRKLEEDANDPLALFNINSCHMISYKPTLVSLRGGKIC